MKAIATVTVLASVLLVFPGSPPFASSPQPAVLETMRPAAELADDLERLDETLVLLHFWASWCLPCRNEMRELAEFRRTDYPEMAADGLRIVTVSNDVRDIDLERFAERVDLVFPLYYDPLSKLTGRYGVRGLPATIVLDRRGNVVEQMLGSLPWSSPAFQGKLWTLLRRHAAEP